MLFNTVITEESGRTRLTILQNQTGGRMSALPLTACVIWDKSLESSDNQLLYLENAGATLVLFIFTAQNFCKN